MKKTIDWSKYNFRASQVHLLMTGKLPIKDDLKGDIAILENERDTLTNVNGNKVKWTVNKQDSLDKLILKEKTPYFKLLPKTMTNELRKIHRAETFGRNFSFTNKFVQKGIEQEEEAISVFQKYRKEFLGINFPFINNKKRLRNEFISGEADLTDTNDFSNCNKGFDTKCSWELETFPFKEDSLDLQYEYQNQSYMWLSGAKKWSTVYVLVNVTEDLLHKEKMKWFYALGQPMSEEDKNYEDYNNKIKELEIRLIFDYDRFIDKNPMHQMEIQRDEWFENGYNIPLKDKVIIKESEYNEFLINDIEKRVEVSRDYLRQL